MEVYKGGRGAPALSLCVAVCCSVLQCVAVCCSVLQCVAVLQCSSVAVLQCCSVAVLQCCSVAVLQCCSIFFFCNTIAYRFASIYGGVQNGGFLCMSSVLQYCSGAVVQCCSDAAMQCCSDTLLQCCSVFFKTQVRCMFASIYGGVQGRRGAPCMTSVLQY